MGKGNPYVLMAETQAGAATMEIRAKSKSAVRLGVPLLDVCAQGAHHPTPPIFAQLRSLLP